MTQIIIYKNDNGNVSVTVPTGAISIEEVLAKDCPNHAVIVDSSELPEEHNCFFNAWELVGGKVIVNLDKAKDITRNSRCSISTCFRIWSKHICYRCRETKTS